MTHSNEYDGLGRCGECGTCHSPEEKCASVVAADLEPREPFTPPPWVINDENPDDLKIECAAYEDETPGICGSHSAEWKLLKCDARLIVAAPRMLKALQACISQFQDENPDDDWDEIKEAREAVAEALNEAQ